MSSLTLIFTIYATLTVIDTYLDYRYILYNEALKGSDYTKP